MFTVKVEGFKELDKALSELPKALARGVLVRALTKAAEPVLIAAQATVPVGTKVHTRKGKVIGLPGDLKRSLSISTKLTRSQRKSRGGKNAPVEVFVGPSYPTGYMAHWVEFGTINAAPHPFMRPAWDSTKALVLNLIQKNLKEEFAKTVSRLVKKYGTNRPSNISSTDVGGA